jgi:hypothetical protein
MSGVICVSVCLCLYFGRVHFNGENDEVDDWYKTFLESILRFCGGDFVEVLKILFSADSGFVCIPFYICCVFYDVVWGV